MSRSPLSELVTDIIIMTLILLPLIAMSSIGIFWLLYNVFDQLYEL